MYHTNPGPLPKKSLIRFLSSLYLPEHLSPILASSTEGLAMHYAIITMYAAVQKGSLSFVSEPYITYRQGSETRALCSPRSVLLAQPYLLLCFTIKHCATKHIPLRTWRPRQTPGEPLVACQSIPWLSHSKSECKKGLEMDRRWQD